MQRITRTGGRMLVDTRELYGLLEDGGMVDGLRRELADGLKPDDDGTMLEVVLDMDCYQRFLYLAKNHDDDPEYRLATFATVRDFISSPYPGLGTVLEVLERTYAGSPSSLRSLEATIAYDDETAST